MFSKNSFVSNFCNVFLYVLLESNNFLERFFFNNLNLPSFPFLYIPGAVALCQAPSGWVTPAGGLRSESSRLPSSESFSLLTAESSSTAAILADPQVDPEKKAKALAKKAEKEAKKLKALSKKASQLSGAAAAAVAADSKKAKAKDEAEAKRAAEAAEVDLWISAARATPLGAKKDVSGEMPKSYAPKAVEAAWYEWWENSGYFKADPDSTAEPFVMVIPPPNVTGSLHIGHALTNAIEDTVIRWRRMSGYNTLWVPGTDHAGIATQTVVEKKVAREQGKTRHDLGREAFLEEVWKYVDEYGGKICHQLRRLGSSVDWSRQAFTMDDNLSAAVKEAFVRLHTGGLIYRDNRLVNWCCKLKTAVSDIEVDYIDVPKRTKLPVPGYDELVEFGAIISFAYPLEGGDGEIVVATTRLETMFGDTAVAVHPEDPRYTHLHGKFAIHPVNGRRIPIITDAELVDPEFGTGAVKITPAHDPNDFATGKRHNLEFINILDDDGCLNGNGTGEFAGQPRFKARLTVAEYLKEQGLFRGVVDNPMRLGLCSRSKDVIEPVLKPQWWVNCQEMAAEACTVVRDGRLEVIPSEFEATWFRWMENIRDWCISRQLWWGHRIPAYYVKLVDEADAGVPGAPSENMGRWVVGRTLEEAEAEAAKQYAGHKYELYQDEDVLDTWFSSGIFPFSVFQWPEENPDLEKFYPGALLETGHDILFFWVARMVMMGMKLTGKVPFKQVFLHSLVRDAHGRKMSKSLGNVIDPINVIEGITLEDLHETLLGGNLDAKEVFKAKAGQKADFPDGIEECGTDALRFALVAYTSQGRDINLDIKRVVAYRHWCNKLWNAIRFAMMNLGENFQPAEEIDVASLPFASRWILSRLSSTTATMVKAMYAYDFATATSAAYSFWQYELCDVFIELAKPAFNGTDEVAKRGTRDALWICLESGMRLLHPFMPFVTEELWQRLPRRPGQETSSTIMKAAYPSAQPAWDNPQVESDMAYVMNVVTKTRALRADYGLVKQKPTVYLVTKDAERAAHLASVTVEIATLTTSAAVEVLPPDAERPHGCGVAILDDVTAIHMGLAGILDASKEVEKLAKREIEAAVRVEQLRKKMEMNTYQEKTPDAVKVVDSERLEKMQAELEAIRHHKEDMKQLMD